MSSVWQPPLSLSHYVCINKHDSSAQGLTGCDSFTPDIEILCTVHQVLTLIRQLTLQSSTVCQEMRVVSKKHIIL